MKEIFIAVISAVGSGAFFTFMQFLISRKDGEDKERKEAKEWRESVDAKLLKNEKDSIRTQMLLLMDKYPDNETEVLRLAEYYFQKLHANFYMTTMFTKWLQLNHIPLPGWFSGDKEEEYDSENKRCD